MSDTSGNLTFEQAMQRLDEIVENMEQNKMPLDDMLSAYAEGMGLLSTCRERVESARRRVELIQAGENEKPVLADFDPTSAEAPQPQATAKPAATAARRKPASKTEAAEDSDDITLF